MNQSNQPICPKCAAVIPDEAPGGLCPKCALEGVATAAKTLSGARKSAPPSIAEIAPHFPELEILELIGAGGMGAVYKARQPQLDRFVALKILSHHLADDPAFVERFNREARVLARLSHPNIVGIHDFGTAGPYCFLTMELVDGVNLRQAMQAGRFTPSEALAMVQYLCSALEFAHAEGILHRDIKPENILIDSKGRIKVADFGIAKLVGEDREQDFTLTLQGSVLGSPHYMAPEQIETPGDVDQRADIYSLGVVLYEMLTGGLPIGRFALPSEKAEMDARIDHIVLRTLEKEREARYQSAGEMITSVDELKSPAALPQTPHSVDRSAARFSLTSALLSGSGVILGILFLMAWIMTMSVSVESPSGMAESISAKLFLAVVHFFAAAGTSLVGFILGARALGEIRSSGGTRGGLGFTIFATTAWPIIFLFMMPLVFMANGAGGLEVFLLLLTTSVASWLLIRGLCRWARGVTREDGTRIHPGLGRPILMALLVAFGVPILIMIGLSAFSDGRDLGTNQQVEEIDWLYGTPELSLAVRVGPKVSSAFRLVWTDAEGNVTREPIGVLSGQESRRGNGKFQDSVVRIGMARGEGDMGFVATIDATGESAGIFGAADLKGWDLQIVSPYRHGFGSPHSSEIQLATLRDANGEIRETLALEVVTTNK